MISPPLTLNQNAIQRLGVLQEYLNALYGELEMDNDNKV